MKRRVPCNRYMNEHGYLDWDSGYWHEHTWFDPIGGVLIIALFIGSPWAASLSPDGWPQFAVWLGGWALMLVVAHVNVTISDRAYEARLERERKEQ